MKTIRQKAFTLLEVTFVLLVFGLLVGSLLAPMSAKLYQHNVKSTKNQLENIKDALLGFVVLNKRLPCPDSYDDNDDSINDYDGEENSPCNTDDTKIEGYLPWKNLGVERYDSWGQPFRYRVDKNYAETPVIIRSLKTDENKVLTIKQKDNLSLTTTEGDGTSRVVAIIFSTGRNAKADSGNKFTVANDATYIQNPIIDENGFDDHLTWLSKHTVMYHLMTSKQWFP